MALAIEVISGGGFKIGNDIIIKINEVARGRFKVYIDAPRNLKVWRMSELDWQPKDKGLGQENKT